jgi:hypothetical protein
MAFLQTRCPGWTASSRESDAPPEQGGLGGPLLACAVALSFCGGLVALAVLPPAGVTLSRGVIVAYGFGSTLLALPAVLLSQTWRRLRASARDDRRRTGAGGGRLVLPVAAEGALIVAPRGR